MRVNDRLQERVESRVSSPTCMCAFGQWSRLKGCEDARSESAALPELHAADDEGTLSSPLLSPPPPPRPPAAVYRRENDVWGPRDAQRRHLKHLDLLKCTVEHCLCFILH